MKKLFTIIFLIFIVLACNTKKEENKHIGEKIFADIGNNYGSNLKQDTLTDGTLVYTFYLKGNECLAKEKSLIGYIDKTLEKVPDEIKEGQLSSTGKYMYNTYKWNTPLITLDIQSSFHFVEENSNDSIYVRIFMNKK